MQNPTLVDVIGDMLDKSETLDAEEVEFGDSDNANVVIPTVGGLGASVSYYSADLTKTPYARITWSWTAPLMYDEDGNIVNQSDPDILDDMYFDPVVDYRFGVTGNGAYPVAFSSTKGSASVVTEAHPLGVNSTITVYAVTKSGLVGPVSQYTASVSKDTTPPGQPSTPTLTTSSGTVSVIYDGLITGSVAQPSDYLFTEVYAGTSNPPTTKVGQTNGRGIVTFAATPGTTVYVRLISYDSSYNASAYSSVVNIVVKSVLDDTDLTDALGSRARVISSVTDPALSGPVSNNDWWFELDAIDDTKIISVYKRVSGVWVLDTINAAAVIAAQSIVAGLLSADSVVASNIKAGEIYAKLTTTGELKADAINTGILNAIVTVSGILRTSETGKRVIIDATGITLYDASDTPITFINTLGESFFNGSVTATSLEVVGSMQLDSNTNRMIPGSALTLESQIQSPPTAPSVINSWDTITLKDSSGVAIPYTYGVSRMSDGKFVSNLGTSYIINNADGTYNSEVIGSSGKTLLGCAVNGSYVYSFTLAPSGVDMKMYLYRTNLTTGNQAYYTSNVTYWPVPAVGPEGDYYLPYTIGQSATSNEVLFTHSGAGKRLTSWSITTTTGDNFTAALNDNLYSKLPANSTGITYKGPVDMGVNYILALEKTSSTSTCRALVLSTATADSDYNFPLATSVANGVGYYSGLWTSSGSNVYFYNGITWTGATTKSHDFAYTYYDTVGTVSESKKSPTTTFAVARRAKIKISVQGWTPDTSTVDSVNELRYYAAVAAGTLKPQGNNNTGVLNLTSISTAGSAPPVSSTFPAASPAIIKSDAGGLEIRGDGVAKFKNGFRVFAQAAATNDAVPAGYTRLLLPEVTDEAGIYTPGTGFILTTEDMFWDFNLNVSLGTSNNRRLIAIEAGTGTAGTNLPHLGRAEGPNTGYSSMSLTLTGIWLPAGTSIAAVIYSAAALTTTTGLRNADAKAFFSAKRSS